MGRLIPAHAGKTLIGGGDERVHGAHPRSRGENRVTSLAAAHSGGSSPLTRGKREACPRTAARERLIPAHAGKTRALERSRARLEAHPRSRGENTGDIEDAVREAGSSPLTRGKPTNLRWQVPQMGLIPAHAGKTMEERAAHVKQQAHPRSRGENPALPSREEPGAGSSPLTRGKHECDVRYLVRSGLIPAHAGKTGVERGPSHQKKAHPRSRGENLWMHLTSRRPRGSSPLTRGKHFESDPDGSQMGLIPAHAGKTHGP